MILSDLSHAAIVFSGALPDYSDYFLRTRVPSLDVFSPQIIRTYDRTIADNNFERRLSNASFVALGNRACNLLPSYLHKSLVPCSFQTASDNKKNNNI